MYLGNIKTIKWVRGVTLDPTGFQVDRVAFFFPFFVMPVSGKYPPDRKEVNYTSMQLSGVCHESMINISAVIKASL